jgi:hypothetical protein
MHQARRRTLAAVVPAILAAGLIAGTASAHGPNHGGGAKHDWKRSIVATGLDNPRGIDLAWYGPVVAEAGSGEVSRIGRSGARTIIDGLPTLTSPEGESTGPVNVAIGRFGQVRVLVGEGPQDVDERFSTVLGSWGSRIVADIAAHQAVDPDPTDGEGNPSQSNPYGIAALRNGKLLVADAGGNDLLLVGRHGRVKTVATIPARPLSTAHVGDPGLPPELPAEAVPTSVAVGPDGYWYVAELTGFPFTPGASRIWRVAPWARDAVCDEDTSDGCRLFADGFTSVTGIDFGRDGSLYVVSIVKNGVLGLFSGTDTTGALYRVKHGKRTEIGEGTLTAPADVAVSRHGTVYVTNRSVMPDGEVVAFRRR